MLDILDKLTAHSRNALKNAFGFALSSGHRTLTPEHILLGLIQQKGSIASQILNKANIKEEEIKVDLASNLPSNLIIETVDLSSSAQKVIEKAFLLASQNQHQYIGTEHLLLSTVLINDDKLSGFLKSKNISPDLIVSQIETVFNSTAKFPDLTGEVNEPQPDNHEPMPGRLSTKNQPSILEYFGTNLTDPILQQKIDPVIGRQDEIERLIQILSRRQKNNPLLLGDPGVGKTAIVEGLAKKIIKGQVPAVLEGKKIFSIDLSSVIAGTSFRGEFENRLKQIIQEAKKDPNIILFIDEIHNLTGAGAAGGSMDAANILKPALARGEIRCIGATTLDYYKKQIESDPALERRFQTIDISQPSVEHTIEILRGIKNNYEIFHNVAITEPAIKAAAELSERYIFDRFLPDKAIDLIDEAAAAAKIKDKGNQTPSQMAILENQLKNLAQKKSDLITQEKFSRAAKLKEKEAALIGKIAELKALGQISDKKNLTQINQADIAKIVSKITGIPLTELVAEERNRLSRLEKTIKEKIFGQEAAIKIVTESIKRARTGIAEPKRPIGSFIFLGPSGVGKTELARVLAETIFGTAQALIKIDMSEFSESFNISKLIGAPAGYIGYKDGAKLTDAVKRRPYSVVLFDEIEKAHPQIFNLLLQVLEDGYLTDATGKTINFRNTVIILTSNLGSENFNRQAAMGFDLKTKKQATELVHNLELIENDVLKKLKDKFPPEFLSRIDKTIVFRPLNEKAITQICRRQLKDLAQRLKLIGLHLNFNDNIACHLAKISFSPEAGGRQIRKNIQELIENPIAQILLKKKAAKLTISLKNNKIKII